MTQPKVYAILGHPVAHSRSPAMHNRAFAALGLHSTYLAFDVAPADLGVAVAGLRALGLAGANITLPHKTAVMAHLDRVSAAARAIGAVNTLYWDEGQLVGDNTDAPGLSRSLLDAGAVLEGAKVTVLGAGGAARAAVVGLSLAGAARVTVAARRAEAALLLASEVGAACAPCPVMGTDDRDLAALFAATDLLVQATSATLEGPAAQAFADTLPLSALPAHATVTDLVYKPRQTTVLRAAQARGLQTVDGLGMLLHQGALAFERWTRTSAPIAAMLEVLEGPAAREPG